MRIDVVPIRKDNYAYLVVDPATGTGAVVDPAEPETVAAAADDVRVTHLLCTHHHPDHSGGNLALAARWPGLEVVGSALDADRIPGLTRPVADGDAVAVGALTFRALSVPGHTRGHVAFVCGDALFSGDTLFLAGCGRLFEGDAAQMHHVLSGVYGALPPETRVFCGHEYTVRNLQFALTVEPDNPAVRAKLAWAEARRAAGLPTVPATLAEERTYNPFLRVEEPGIQRRLGTKTAVETLAALRQLKDAF
jgi:hydroxyacylglutathione hydrolase